MKTLVEGYYYLFFRLWRWHRKHFGESDLPHLNATLNLGMLVIVNWITFLLIVEWLFGVRITSWSKMEATIAVVVIGIVLYAVFFYKERYRTIIDRFNHKGVEVNKTIHIISNAYPILTFLAIIGVGILAWGINDR